MPDAPPAEVVALAQERAGRRMAKDFAAADGLRARIEELGWTVLDAADGGFVLEAATAVGKPARPRADAHEIVSVLADPAAADASVHWLVEEWPQDVIRGIESFRRYEAGLRVQHVVVDVVGTDPTLWPDGVEVLELAGDAGWAAARNAGLHRSVGEIVLVVDGSVEIMGGILEPIRQTLRDPNVGVCGPFGIVTDDLREFRDDAGPDVDAIEGYLLAIRRPVLLEVGLFDEKFRFYRTCDIEFSFRVKDSGRRAVVVPVPVRRHEHRAWITTPSERRDQLSKRNYYRFLDRFRGRFDLTVAGDPKRRDRRGGPP
ncbi:MAG: glycosyltransferase [Actinomycetota bacterium]